MDYDQDYYKARKNPTEVYRWMGWLYTIVGCFIVALLVLMFLDMSNHSRQEYYQEVASQTIPANTLNLTPNE